MSSTETMQVGGSAVDNHRSGSRGIGWRCCQQRSRPCPCFCFCRAELLAACSPLPPSPCCFRVFFSSQSPAHGMKPSRVTFLTFMRIPASRCVPLDCCAGYLFCSLSKKLVHSTSFWRIFSWRLDVMSVVKRFIFKI